jgi:nitrate reductase (cytochrome), electron transfer subunit
MPANSTSSTVAGRGVQLFLVAVIGMALVGLVVGMRQGATIYEPAPRDSGPTLTGSAAIPATDYSQFDRRRFGPNAQWRSSLDDLPQPELTEPETAEWNEEARAILRSLRAQGRAFDGAPPTIPHPIDQMTSASCLACHATGRTIGQIHAPAMSHELLHNCTQCHVERQSADLAAVSTVRNIFESLESSAGARAWPGAPPTIPHTTHMRQNCLSCHGAQGSEAIRTTHPWRANCMQCHAPSAENDQAVFDSGGPFLPPPAVEQP